MIPDAGPILDGGEITLALLVQPTYRAPATQVLAACGDPWAGHGFALALDSELRPALVGGLAPDEPVTCPALLQPGTWSLVLATFGGEAPSRVTAGPLAGTPASWSHAGGSPVTLPPLPSRTARRTPPRNPASSWARSGRRPGRPACTSPGGSSHR